MNFWVVIGTIAVVAVTIIALASPGRFSIYKDRQKVSRFWVRSGEGILVIVIIFIAVKIL